MTVDDGTLALPQALRQDAAKAAVDRCAERAQRLATASAMGQPDRIPLFLGAGYLVAEMAGITRQRAYEDAEAGLRALLSTAEYFQPDTIIGPWHTPEPSKLLGDRSTRWPGYGLPEDGSYQYVESEFMKADDYDDFLEDPTDWAIRRYLPRVFAELEGFSALPTLGMALFGYYNVFNIMSLTSPGVARGVTALSRAAQAQVDWVNGFGSSIQRMMEAGFAPPPNLGFILEAPFDFMSDTLRGMKGIFLDMRQRPDKLLAAQRKAIRIQLRAAREYREATGETAVFLPLHRGSDGFMSLQQFDRFYWPQFEELMFGLMDLGFTPWVYYEGVWNQRLEHLTRFPRGRSVGIFQNSDIFKVKEVVGDTMCIVGGMPTSMINSASPGQLRDLTHELCERVGRGGGFVMSTSVLELEGCDPERARVWTDATREYGVY